MCTACQSTIFFFNDTATTEIYTLSLHDALPIWSLTNTRDGSIDPPTRRRFRLRRGICRSEEHTSELQSRENLVCRLLLEKKKKIGNYKTRIKPATLKPKFVQKCDAVASVIAVLP